MTQQVQAECNRALMTLLRFTQMIERVKAGEEQAETALRNACNFEPHDGLYLKVKVEDLFAAMEDEVMSRADGPDLVEETQ